MSAACVIAATLYHLLDVLPYFSNFNHVSGIWTTLAQDFNRGVFYRPLLGEDGYGGTRYMPVHFLLHAWGIRLTGHPIATGYALSILSVTGIVGATYAMLRVFRVRRFPAVAAALLVLAPAAVQLAVSTVRGDALAAALNLTAVAVVVSQAQDPRGLRGLSWARAILPAFLFAVAFLCKFTTLFGLAAVVIWFWIRPGHRASAARLVLLAVGLMGAGLLLTQWASDGRFLESMRACAQGGGWTLRGLRHLANRALTTDPVGTLIIGLATAIGLSSARRSRGQLPFLLFLFTGAATAVVFLSPGADWNHLIDAEVAGLILLVYSLEPARPTGPSGRAILAMIGILGAIHTVTVGTVGSPRGPDPSRREAVSAIQDLSSPSRPVLVENSGLALQAGVHPYLLDAFTLRILRAGNPVVDRDFLGGMDQRRWSAVVLIKDAAEDPDGWYETVHFGPGFRERLLLGYRRSDDYPKAYVYVPR